MADLRIPKPEIHTGPKHMTVDEATIHYLREAAERVRAARIWGSGVSALVATVLDDTAAALLASSAPATASEGATEDKRPCRGVNANVCVGEGCYGEACVAGVTLSDGDRGLSEEWSEERRTEHFYRQYGRTFSGYGPSMDPHRCGDPDEECWTVTESRRVTPWEVVGDE